MPEGDDLELLPAVRETCGALELGPQHAALVRVAEVLAATIDGMSGDERPRMLGQTVPPLLRALDQLALARLGGHNPPGISEADLDLLLGGG